MTAGNEQMSFHRVLASLQDIGGLLIKRGSAMGPLVPTLLLVPVLLGAAWLFRSVFVVKGCPIISTGLVILVLWIVVIYLRHYASFAKNDPDRLQSEENRYQTARMRCAKCQAFFWVMPKSRCSFIDDTPLMPVVSR